MIEGAVVPHKLPEAIDEHSYFRGRLVDIGEVKGWRVDPDWAPADKAGTRERFVHVPMLIGEAAGEECRFAFDGTAVGVFVAAGPDTGVVEFRIDGGEWRRQNLMTNWSKTLHIPWAYVLDADLVAGRHELTMRMSQGVIRVTQMLVN
jgi:sialidase-1